MMRSRVLAKQNAKTEKIISKIKMLRSINWWEYHIIGGNIGGSVIRSSNTEEYLTTDGVGLIPEQ